MREPHLRAEPDGDAGVGAITTEEVREAAKAARAQATAPQATVAPQGRSPEQATEQGHEQSQAGAGHASAS